MTVREVADRYGVTTGFMVQALAKVGYNAAGPDAVLPAPVLARFESEFGEKIRAKRSAPEPVTERVSDSPPVPASPRDRLGPKPHVMRVAHAEATAVRVSAGHIEKRLVANPGFVHAIDAAGTQDGDPWDGEVAPGRVHFYDGSIHSGPRAACGYAHMRVVLGDEFVPADDPVQAGQCPRCAEIVRAGKGFRQPPNPFGYYRSPFCEKYLRVKVAGVVKVKECFLRDSHPGQPHRDFDGSEWTIGLDDYVPAPDEVGRSITAA